MDLNKLCVSYKVRKLVPEDREEIYELSMGNPMFFEYCPPVVTRDNVLDDMKALPPGMTYEDKYYIGFFREEKLVAIMDLIMNYPDKDTAFIGLFMMDAGEQGKGVGTKIIEECLEYLKEQGYKFARLGIAKGNPQPEAFWTKNGFEKLGTEKDNGGYIVVPMTKSL